MDRLSNLLKTHSGRYEELRACGRGEKEKLQMRSF
jgi:hypothetical protein